MALSQDQFDHIVRDMPGFGRDPASVRRRIEAMEAMLEGLFVIPGTNRRVGLDSLVGLVPVVGDIATAAMVNPLTAQQIRREWARNGVVAAPGAHRFDESPAGYSLAGWSPPEPASASPAQSSMHQNGAKRRLSRI